MFEIGPPSGTCSGFHPAYSCPDGFWDLNRDAFLYAARLAQEPLLRLAAVLGPAPRVILWTTVDRGGTMKRNLTVQLDDEIVVQAKVLAARRGTSVSTLVAATLKRMVEDDERYQAARERAGRALGQARPHGGRTWQRADLYDR